METDTIGPLLKMAGAGLRAYGLYTYGKEAQAIARYNQAIANMQAAEVERATSFIIQRQAEEASRLLSSQQAAYGAAGYTNLLALAKQASELELQRLMTAREGKMQATALKAEGKMMKYKGAVERQQAYISTGATLLEGFGNLFG